MNFSAQKPNAMTIANVVGPETMERIGVAEQTFKASCFMLDKELARAKNSAASKETPSFTQSR